MKDSSATFYGIGTEEGELCSAFTIVAENERHEQNKMTSITKYFWEGLLLSRENFVDIIGSPKDTIL